MTIKKMTQAQFLKYFSDIETRLEAYCKRVNNTQTRGASDFWVMQASRQLNRNVNGQIAQAFLDTIREIQAEFNTTLEKLLQKKLSQEDPSQARRKAYQDFYQHLCQQFSKKSISVYQTYAIGQLEYTDKTPNFVKRDIHSSELKSILADARKYFPENHAEFKQRFDTALQAYIDRGEATPSGFLFFNASRRESRKLNVQLAGNLQILVENSKDISNLKTELSQKSILDMRAKLIRKLSAQDPAFQKNFVDRGINSHELNKIIHDMRASLDISLPEFEAEPAAQSPELSVA